MIFMSGMRHALAERATARTWLRLGREDGFLAEPCRPAAVRARVQQRGTYSSRSTAACPRAPA
ncbi:hypothetical protein ADK59_20670 [Streptomyces sp. XY332]|nr:hypothetical protein ADK59_20670 [Streptomyces sp. XY332]